MRSIACFCHGEAWSREASSLAAMRPISFTWSLITSSIAAWLSQLVAERVSDSMSSASLASWPASSLAEVSRRATSWFSSLFCATTTAGNRNRTTPSNAPARRPYLPIVGMCILFSFCDLTDLKPFAAGAQDCPPAVLPTRAAYTSSVIRLSTSVIPGADHATRPASSFSIQARTAPLRIALLPCTSTLIFFASS